MGLPALSGRKEWATVGQYGPNPLGYTGLVVYPKPLENYSPYLIKGWKINQLMDLAYSIGLIGGDGSLVIDEKRNDFSLHVVDQCLSFHKQIIFPIFERLFGITPKLSPMKTRLGRITYRSRIRDEKIVRFYLDLDVPLGKEKTYRMKTLSFIWNLDDSKRAAYMRGWMDAEGSLTTHTVKRTHKKYVYPKVTFQVANKTIRNDLTKILSSLDVHFTVWNHKQMHGFQIVGQNNVFQYFGKVGFNHPDKLPNWG
jgi:hypothetical protein